MTTRSTSRRWSTSGIVPMFATGAVLAALLGDHAFFKKAPPEAETYHQAVKAAADKLPMTFGSWLGMDVAVPVAAVKMLHPNVILSRRFQNIATEESVSILLVHVKDARDLLGHYPPVCYPGQGWKLQASDPIDWNVGERAVQGTEYKFERDHGDGGTRIVVDNLFVMRGGTVCRNMDDVEVAAQDRQRKFFGAAQVQFVHDASMPPQRRRECVQEIMKAMEPAIAAISTEDPA